MGFGCFGPGLCGHEAGPAGLVKVGTVVGESARDAALGAGYGGHANRDGSGLDEDVGAGAGGRAGGKDVVDQQYVTAPDEIGVSYEEGSAKIDAPLTWG